MIENARGLLLLPLQSAERVDFELEPGVVLFAILFFVLINLLLAAVLYPYFTGSSGEDQPAKAEQSAQQGTAEVASSDDKSTDERMDQFVEDIEKER